MSSTSSKIKPPSRPVPKVAVKGPAAVAPPKPPALSQASLSGAAGLGSTISELIANKAPADSLSVAGSGDRSAAAAVAARRSAVPPKKAAPDQRPSTDVKPIAPAPLNIAELAGRDVPTFCRLWNGLIRERSPKWVLTPSEIERLADTLPPVLIKYLPAVEKYGPEVALGFCLLTIAVPRIDFGRSAPVVQLPPVPKQDSTEGPPAPTVKADAPVHPLSVFFPNGVPRELLVPAV